MQRIPAVKRGNAEGRPTAPRQRFFTDEVLDDRLAAVLRAKSPAERLAIAFHMWAFARDLIWRTAARQHPEWSEEKLARHVAGRMSHGAV
jgi:hypothetical protein